MLTTCPPSRRSPAPTPGSPPSSALSVMRLRRRLATERHPDNELSLGAMAVLGALYRNGDLTVGELAAHERVQPPSMTRTVNCLEEGGYVTRRAARDRRPPGRGRADRAAAGRPLLADRARRDAWLAHRLRDLTPEERAVLRQAAPILEDSLEGLTRLEPHVPLPPQPATTAVRRRQRRVEHRHLDAAGRPGLAGAPAHRQQRHRARHHHRAAVPARPAALAVRRRDRRPLPQAPAAPAHPG